VEGEGGRFRRRHLVPIPVVGSLTELNQHLAAADAADDARRIGHRTSTVGEDFAAEQSHLLALPAEPFDAARILPARRVDHKARVCVRQHHYSVPGPVRRPHRQRAAGREFPGGPRWRGGDRPA
jgi:hypothetical protein